MLAAARIDHKSRTATTTVRPPALLLRHRRRRKSDAPPTAWMIRANIFTERARRLCRLDTVYSRKIQVGSEPSISRRWSWCIQGLTRTPIRPTYLPSPGARSVQTRAPDAEETASNRASVELFSIESLCWPDRAGIKQPGGIVHNNWRQADTTWHHLMMISRH